MKDKLIKISAEAGMICFSVLLAFWLNELRLDYGKEQDTIKALNAIKAEIQTNKTILEKWLPYHNEVIEKLELAFEQDNLPKPFNQSLFTDERGIFKELLTSNARNLLNNANIEVDIEKRLMIERIYEHQSFVITAHQKAFHFVDSREIFKPELAFENYLIFQTLMKEVYGQEEALIRGYHRILEKPIWPN